MSLTSLAIKYAAPVPKPEDFDRFLFLGPHPDDIEIGAGATIAKLVANGKSVAYLICTDGRYGLENAPEGITPEQLADIRKQESIDAAAFLGVRDVRFLGLSDGGNYSIQDLNNGIAKTIGDFQPDIVFAPDPCVKSECHKDHLNVGNAARQLAFFAQFDHIMKNYGAESADVKAIAFYMTARPNRFVATGKFKEAQLKALSMHKSQFPQDSEAFKQIKLYLSIRAADFGIRSLKGCAEGFRVLGRTHMHCTPETDK